MNLSLCNLTIYDLPKKKKKLRQNGLYGKKQFTMARTVVFITATFAFLVVVVGDLLTSYPGSYKEFTKYSVDTWGDYTAILLHAVSSDKVSYFLHVFEKDALLWQKEWTGLTAVSGKQKKKNLTCKFKFNFRKLCCH